MASLDHYLRAFSALNVNRSGGRPSPHKPCMLLAMLGLADAGLLKANEIRFEPPLLERYARVFDAVRHNGDQLNPYFPFFHLKSEGFWHLTPIQGREAIVTAMDTARSMAAISENVEYAYLADDLHRLVLDPHARAILREHLVTVWFGDFRLAVDLVLREEGRADDYESAIRAGTTATAPASDPSVLRPARDAAFRRVVTALYDYRCAASGWRIILPQGTMVEAAHIIPFAETYDDDPRNGIALTPSFHWAFDAGIISPGPDYKWHVSSSVDSRIADNQPLLTLEGKDLLLPRNRPDWPREDALAWRLNHLLE